MVMDPESHLNFTARGLYQLVTHVLRQMPAVYGVHVNPETFLNSFHFQLCEDNQEERIIKTQSWAHAPSGDIHGRASNSGQPTLRDEIEELFTTFHWPKMTQAIPYASNTFPFPDNVSGRPSKVHILVFKPHSDLVFWKS